MASKSNIESLEELIIKVIGAIRKSQKRPHKIRIYDFTKIFLEKSSTSNGLFWERMKFLEENGLIYNKPTKHGNSPNIS